MNEDRNSEWDENDTHDRTIVRSIGTDPARAVDASETNAERSAPKAPREDFASLPDAFRDMGDEAGESMAEREDVKSLPAAGDRSPRRAKSRGALWLSGAAILIAVSGTGYSIWNLTAQASDLERVTAKVGEIDVEQGAIAKTVAHSGEWLEGTQVALESVQDSLAQIRGNNAEMIGRIDSMTHRIVELEERVKQNHRAAREAIEAAKRPVKEPSRPARPAVAHTPARVRPPELKLVSMVSYGPEVYVMVMSGDRTTERMTVGTEFRGWTLLEADPLSHSAIFLVAGERKEVRL